MISEHENAILCFWYGLLKKNIWNTRWSVKRVYFGYFGGHDSHVTWISGYTSPLYMMSPEFKCEMLLKRIIISHWIKKLSFLYSVRHSFISTWHWILWTPIFYHLPIPLIGRYDKINVWKWYNLQYICIHKFSYALYVANDCEIGQHVLLDQKVYWLMKLYLLIETLFLRTLMLFPAPNNLIFFPLGYFSLI